MEIILRGLSKKFNQDWLFKDLNNCFSTSQAYAITGPNGSGKTTLIKMISGMMPSTSGTIEYRLKDRLIDPEHVYRYLTLVAPYLELLEELTLVEFLRFHFKLKPAKDGLSFEGVANRAKLESVLFKPLNTFSSGMKQRVKLALGIFSSAPVLLLDEPTTNLDSWGISWYKEEISTILSEKLIIIGSNQPHEYEFCGNIMELGAGGPDL